MEFNRGFYLQKLISASKNDMIKIITGIRRCGKSYLLFEIFRNYLLSQGVQEDHIIGLAMDDNHNKSLRNPDKGYHLGGLLPEDVKYIHFPMKK